MKNWFTSLNGAVTLTALTIFSEGWRGFLDAMFVFPVEFNDPISMQAGALIFAVVFGGWTWALVLAWQGNRRALIITFSLNLLVLLAVPISWLFFYCPPECQAEAGIFNLANTLNLILGVLAAISLSFHLRRKSAQTVAVGSSD
jgi:hypothetical protein